LGFSNGPVDDLEKQLETFLRQKPALGPNVFLARGAVLVGAVTLGHDSSVWYNAVLRADINTITVGHHTNIQDNAVLHVADDHPCVIGDHVTIGHGAVVHGCTVGNETLIGMGAAVLDGAVVGSHCIVAAHALVPQGMHVPDGTLVMRAPARVTRALTPEEREHLRFIAEKYAANAAFCMKHGINVEQNRSA
jgi:carbonic anhydrase/acetyltransferase-like protein (isoleucine patch superfamily)